MTAGMTAATGTAAVPGHPAIVEATVIVIAIIGAAIETLIVAGDILVTAITTVVTAITTVVTVITIVVTAIMIVGTMNGMIAATQTAIEIIVARTTNMAPAKKCYRSKIRFCICARRLRPLLTRFNWPSKWPSSSKMRDSWY